MTGRIEWIPNDANANPLGNVGLVGPFINISGKPGVVGSGNTPVVVRTYSDTEVFLGSLLGSFLAWGIVAGVTLYVVKD